MLGSKLDTGCFENTRCLEFPAETHGYLAQLYQNNPTLAQQHYQTAHQIYTHLGAKKDLDKIERE